MGDNSDEKAFSLTMPGDNPIPPPATEAAPAAPQVPAAPVAVAVPEAAETPAEPAAAPQNFAVDVVDHDSTDVDVPEDLSGEEGPFWKRKDVRLWLYILGGAVVVFAIVFAILTKQTSLFKGYTLLENSSTTAEEDIFDSYNESADSDTGEDIFDDTSDADPFGEEPVVDDEYVPIFDDEDLPEDADDYILALDDNDEETIVTQPTTTYDEYEDPSDYIFDSIFELPEVIEFPDSIPVTTVPDQPPANPPTLASNTDTSVVASSEIQGNTGPGAAVAFIPSILFSLAHFRRKLWS